MSLFIVADLIFTQPSKLPMLLQLFTYKIVQSHESNIQGVTLHFEKNNTFSQNECSTGLKIQDMFITMTFGSFPKMH